MAQAKAIEQCANHPSLAQSLIQSYAQTAAATNEQSYEPQVLLDGLIRYERQIIDDHNHTHPPEYQVHHYVLPSGIDLRRVDLHVLALQLGFTRVNLSEMQPAHKPIAAISTVNEVNGGDRVLSTPAPEVSGGQLAPHAQPFPPASQMSAGPASLAPWHRKTARAAHTTRAQPMTLGTPAPTVALRAINGQDVANPKSKRKRKRAEPTPGPRKCKPKDQRKTTRLGQGDDDEWGKIYTAPSSNVKFPNGNITAAEILAYLPQWVKSWDVIERFASNGAIPSTIAAIINHFRTQERGAMYANAVWQSQKVAVQNRGLKEPRWRDWQVQRHINAPDWDETSISTRGYRTPFRTYQIKGTDIDVSFESLADGVKTMPSDGDALDLTRMIQLHQSQPERDLLFPRDWDLLLWELGGPAPVTEEHFDRAVFGRYEKDNIVRRIRSAQEAYKLKVQQEDLDAIHQQDAEPEIDYSEESEDDFGDADVESDNEHDPKRQRDTTNDPIQQSDPTNLSFMSPNMVRVRHPSGDIIDVDRNLRDPLYFDDSGNMYLSAYPDPKPGDFSDFAENLRWACISNYASSWTSHPAHQVQMTEIRQDTGWFSDEYRRFMSTSLG
jgi:hypothetical protein